MGDQEEDQKCVHQYRGESSKTTYSRNLGHLAKFKSKGGSFMSDHIRECAHAKDVVNPGPQGFQMEVVSRDKGPLRRVLREAIRIRDVLDGEEVVVKEKYLE